MLKRAVFGLAAGVLWFVSLGAAGIEISVDPIDQQVEIGNQVSLDVNISGLGDGAPPSVGEFDITVDFDGGLLGLADVVFGDGLDLGIFGSFQETIGTNPVNVFELSFEDAAALNTLQPGAFRLFTLTFDTLALGTSPIDLTLITLGDADGAPLSADLVNGLVRIVPPAGMPIPATLALVGFGLILLGRERLRRPAAA